MYNLLASINGFSVPLGTLITLPDGKGGFTGSVVSSGLTIPITATLAAITTAPPLPPPGGPSPTITSATPWPTQVLLSFEPAAAPTGKSIVSYTAVGINAVWLISTGSADETSIMTQGGWSVGSTNDFTIHANYSDGTSSTASAPSPRCAPLAIGTPSTSPNVYRNGVFYWGGDYSYGSGEIEDYAHLDPAGVCFRIKYTNSGGWQPFAPTNAFDLTPFTELSFDWKSDEANDPMVLRCEVIGDKSVGNAVSLADGTYGPVPQPGVWGSYKVPLSAMGIGVPAGIPTLYKLQFTNPNGTFARTEYFKEIYFS